MEKNLKQMFDDAILLAKFSYEHNDGDQCWYNDSEYRIDMKNKKVYYQYSDGYYNNIYATVSEITVKEFFDKYDAVEKEVEKKRRAREMYFTIGDYGYYVQSRGGYTIQTPLSSALREQLKLEGLGLTGKTGNETLTDAHEISVHKSNGIKFEKNVIESTDEWEEVVPQSSDWLRQINLIVDWKVLGSLVLYDNDLNEPVWHSFIDGQIGYIGGNTEEECKLLLISAIDNLLAEQSAYYTNLRIRLAGINK